MKPPPKSIALPIAAGIALALFFGHPEPQPQAPTEGPRSSPSLPQAATQKPLPQFDCRNFFAVACGRRDVTTDPSGLVKPNVKGELEALRLYERIIREHPDRSSEEIDELLVKEIYTEPRRKRLRETFAWVKKKMKTFFAHQPAHLLSSSQKSVIQERIDATVLELPPPASLYAAEPDLLTKNELYYETLENGRGVIRVGGAYVLTAKSWFNRVFSFAHELAHSIDPCELQSVGLSVPAYRNLASCFHREGLSKTPGGDLRCGQNRRLGEAFGDWVATEITADALELLVGRAKTYEDRLLSAINAVRDLCNQESWIEESDEENYPDPRLRIGLIFGRHPRITRFLQCAAPPEPSPYCHFGGP